MYRGTFHGGKRHGFGQIRFAIGDVYDGEWKDDQYDGKGEFRFHTGIVWRGHFLKGSFALCAYFQGAVDNIDCV